MPPSIWCADVAAPRKKPRGAPASGFAAAISAALNAIGQLMFVTVYPWWGIAMFTLDILVIYGLIVYAGKRLRAD